MRTQEGVCRLLQVLLFIGMSTIAVVCHAAPSLAWKTSVYSTGDADAIPGGDLTGRARKAMAIDSVGNVYVFGSSGVGGVTIKYSPNGAKLWEIVRKNFTPVAIVLDPAGDIYATGSNHNGSNFDYVTAKFNSSGVEQWRQVANGANNRDDQALAIALDINGNVIVTGKSQNANPTSRALDFLTIKYSAAGIEQWRAVANGSGDFNDTAYAVAADVDGSVVVTGRGASTNDDYLTIKYNAMGVEQWRAVMNGNPSGYQYDVPSAMVMDAGGNIYVTGTSGNTAGTTDYLTVKYDSAGTEIWRRSLNSNLGGSEAFALALAPDGDVVVTGYGGTAGGSEYMTIRYASDGTEKWRVAMDPGPNRIAAGYSIVIGSDNSTYVTGVALIGPNYDYVTVKYNAAGTELWRTASQGGPDTQDYSYLLSLDGDGNVIVGGYSTARNYNFLIVKLDANGAELWRGREGRLNGLESTLGSGYSARQAMTTDAARNSYITGSAANGEAPLSTEYLTVKLGPDGEEVWRVQTAGGTAKAYEARAIAVDLNGNVIVTGRGVNGGMYVYLTIKYGPAGNELWQSVMMRGFGDEAPVGIATDSAGNVFVTGISTGAGGRSEILTVKYSAAGMEQWRAVAAGVPSETAFPTAIRIDSAGNVMVTGAAIFSTQSDFLTIKYAQDGTELWRATMDGASHFPDRPVAMASDGAGNTFVYGLSASDRNGSSYNELLLVKYGTSGIEQWRQLLTDRFGLNAAATSTLAVDTAGNAYVTGYGFGVTSGTQITTAKFAPSGQLLWSRKFQRSATSDDVSNSLALDRFDNVYVAGSTYSGGPEEFLLIKYDKNGNEKWNSVIDRASIGYGAALTVRLDQDNSIYLAGDLLGDGNFHAMSVVKLTQPLLAPSAPSILSIEAGNASARITFTAPVDSGDAPVTGYLADCDGVTASGTMSPIVVGGLINGTTYSCRVFATSLAGTGVASNVMSVTPATSAVWIVSAKSRKEHQAAGDHDIVIELAPVPESMTTVEPRAIGAGYKIIVELSGSVISLGSARALDSSQTLVGSTVATVSGNMITLHVADVPDGSRVSMELANLNGIYTTFVPIRFLTGDVNGSGLVGAADIFGVKVRNGQSTNGSNFRFDLDASGSITATDILIVKSRSGHRLP